MTTNFREGYLRKNGVPYSEQAVITEYIHRLPTHPNGDNWLQVITIVEDPRYLTQPFYTSTNFRLEPNDTNFRPTPCADGAAAPGEDAVRKPFKMQKGANPVVSGWPALTEFECVCMWNFAFTREGCPTSPIRLDDMAHRPWPLPDGPWVMTQSWHDLLFAHWPVDARALQEKLPAGLPLDTFEGRRGSASSRFG